MWCHLAGMLGGLALCHGSVWGQLAADRVHDPVILTGVDLVALLGRPVDSIVAFRYDDGWIQVPVQVDERAVVDYAQVYNVANPTGVLITAYADPDTYMGADPDPTFDFDDELVFMAGEAAGPAPRGAGYPPGVSCGPTRQIMVTDPIDTAVAFVYLFGTDGTLDPAAGVDDVTYTFNLLAGDYIPAYDTLTGPNPENSVVTTDAYRVHFSDRWIRDETNIFAGGANGADLLDRHKNLFAPGNCGRTENTFSAGEGAFFANRAGPVRAIRSYMGANSGPLTQRTHHFYPTREDIATHLRVHAISSVADLFDYSPDAAGMVYANDLNPGGVDVDGVSDVVAPGAIAWELVTGAPGSLIHSLALTTDIPGLAATSYYSDDLSPSVTQCTGDAFEYATSGTFIDQAIPNTDPQLEGAFVLVLRRTIYYEPPGRTTFDAARRDQQAGLPPTTVVGPFMAILGDVTGDGSVDVTDLLQLLASWGPCAAPCPADTNDDGDVNVTDLLSLLAGWGACP